MKTLKECTILVVDDVETNLEILVGALGDLYDVSVAMDGKWALQAVEKVKPDLILLDIMMPGMDGYEVCRRLKESAETDSIPIIFLTALTEIDNKTKGFELGAVDYIAKPFEILEIQSRVKTHLSLVLASRSLERQNETRELVISQDVIIQTLASLAEARDNETGGHIMRTQRYVKLLAEHLKEDPIFSSTLDDRTIELLVKSAPLHDIGKVRIPDAFFIKPARLTKEEFEKMKKHTIYGRDALRNAINQLGLESSTSFLQLAMETAYTHHEKWDGSGYPNGTAGSRIPIPGRLMALADVYDALVRELVYKPGFSHRKAVVIIKEDRGTQFDPRVVDAFLEQEAKFREVVLELPDSEEGKGGFYGFMSS